MLAAALALLSACGQNVAEVPALTAGEKALIDSEGIMRVLQVTDPEDSLVLRSKCVDLSPVDLRSPLYGKLARRMLDTVTDPSQDGVGIAAPQVGLLRRVVAVMRYDKEGTPFEVYPNIYIEDRSEETQIGPEGCLSIPDAWADVKRAQTVMIRYTDTQTLETVRDTVSGYTAVIFQHETDHLEGILFTDYSLEN